MEKEVYLVSFASNDLDASVKRFLNQAKNLNFYKKIKIYRPKDLSNDVNERINFFRNKGKDRYYGFEIWKENIVRKYLSEIPENSILQYTDIGCHLNNNGLKKLKEYINIADKNNMLVFQYGNTPLEMKKKYDYNFQTNNEYNFVKADLINHMGLEINNSILKEPQIWCGAWFLKKNDFAIKFLNQWKEIIKHDHLIDDSVSKIENHKDFKIHLACQASFSLLSKIKKVEKVSASECEWAESKDGSGRKWDHLDNYPILAKRDLKYGILKRFFNRQKKNLKRFKKNFF